MSISPSPRSPRDDLVAQLDGFSQSALKKIAQTIGVPARSADRSSYLEAIADFIATPRHRQILEARLPERLWAILNLLPLHAGPLPLRSLFVPLRKLGVQPGDELSLLSTLIADGCLLPASQLGGSQRLNLEPSYLSSSISNVWFAVPIAVRSWVRERFPDSYALKVADPPLSIVGPDVNELRRATYLVLAEVSAKPIKLTTVGLPYKNELVRLTAALSGVPVVKGKGSRSKEVSPPAPLLWFILAALLGADLVHVAEQQLSPSPAVAAFQALSPEEQIANLTTGWLRGPYDDVARIPTIWSGYDDDPSEPPWVDDNPYGDGQPNATRQVLARAFLLTAFSFAAKGAPSAWYGVDDLVNLVHDAHPELLFNNVSDYELLNPKLFERPTLGRRIVEPYPGLYRSPNPAKPREDLTLYPDRDWPLVEGAFVRQILVEPLRWLGLVDVGPDPAAPERFRLTALGRHRLTGEPLDAPEAAARDQTSAVVVQPNFEVVVVDALASTSVLAQLDIFADRRSFDRAATYHLSQAALLRGLDRGWTGARVLDTLAALNRGPIPQNVQYTLQEWIRLYERLTLRESVTLLEADSPAQLDSWLATREVAPLLGKRLGPTSILIPAINLDQVAISLKKNARVKLAVVDYTYPRRQVVDVRDPDLIVADAPDPYLDYRLRAFSTPILHEKSQVTYQITAETVGAARRVGLSGDNLIDFLEIAATDALPNEVVVRLLGWSGDIVPMTYQPVVAVYLPSPSIDWTVLARIPSIGRLIQNVVQLNLALVTPENVEPLRAELAGRGLTVKSGILPIDENRVVAAPAVDPLANLSLVEKAMASILGEQVDRLGDVDLPWPIFRVKKSK